MPREHNQTVREVAGLAKVGEATVRRWIREGQLRAIHIGKQGGSVRETSTLS
ncbi:helix-turn-helix domain-containing protein [Labrenzia sp. 011]|uniref:helix-turn-helix domain-containing protein n=1 Tax=Labrenzia sp. 011 TaxID=2171494 RepID=UPI001AD8A5E1|nr:helix-turn-helix domain-containing protein [Labrenzia sp. 011]